MLNGITADQAEDIFFSDLGYATVAVYETLTFPDWPTDNFYDALIMFAFNIGDDNFRSSQLARLVNSYPAITDQELYNFWLSTWVGSPPKQVLLNRRETEATYAYQDIDLTFTTIKKKTNYSWLWLLLIPVGMKALNKSNS